MALSYYTAGPTLKTDIDSATSEASGFVKEYVNDFDPDTWWKKSTSATQYLAFDNNQTVAVEALVLFIHNYTSVSSSTCALVHDNNSGFTSPTTSVSAGQLLDTATPLRIFDFTSSSERYWRLQLPNADIQVSMVLFCQKWTVSQGREFPIADTDRFGTKILMAPGGRQHPVLQNQHITGRRVDSFAISGTTDYDALRGAFVDAKGNALPVVRQPGSTNSDAEIGRFVGAQFNRTEVDYQYYKPTVAIDLMPYIDAGETY